MEDPERFFSLHFTWAFHVCKLLPFTFGADDTVREFLRSCVKPEFQNVKVYPDKAKSYLIELYVHVRESVIKDLRSAVSAGAPIAQVAYNIDLWKCKTSQEKYLGEH